MAKGRGEDDRGSKDRPGQASSAGFIAAGLNKTFFKKTFEQLLNLYNKIREIRHQMTSVTHKMAVFFYFYSLWHNSIKFDVSGLIIYLPGLVFNF